MLTVVNLSQEFAPVVKLYRVRGGCLIIISPVSGKDAIGAQVNKPSMVQTANLRQFVG
jgi:hypothetical protein